MFSRNTIIETRSKGKLTVPSRGEKNDALKGKSGTLGGLLKPQEETGGVEPNGQRNPGGGKTKTDAHTPKI